MYLLIDNYDSFVYNLAAYLREEGANVQVTRCDALRRAAIETLYQGHQLEGIIISPGPKRPEENHIVRDILRDYEGRVPILGVCLGHQMIAHHHGAIMRRSQLDEASLYQLSHHKELIPNWLGKCRPHPLEADHELWPHCSGHSPWLDELRAEAEQGLRRAGLTEVLEQLHNDTLRFSRKPSSGQLAAPVPR